MGLRSGGTKRLRKVEGIFQNYIRTWRLWLDWCKKYPESITRPAQPFYVALFFNELVLDEAKKGRIESAFFGIRWGHLIAGLTAPTDHPFVKLAFEGAKRLASRRTAKIQKEPSKHAR